MKTNVAILSLLAAVVSGQTVWADEAPAPPSGWEVPPSSGVLNDKPTKGKKKVGPACCAFDSTCCSRQSDIDAHGRPQTVDRVVVVRFADLPEAILREVAAGAPPIEDAPPVRLVNEDSQPYPWPKTPKQIRMLPPGPLGDINWNAEYFVPSFDEKEFQSLGWGTIHYVRENVPFAPDAEIAGKVQYDSIQQGAGDKLIFDSVVGTVSGSPKLKATYHLHAEAAHIADQVVHGYWVTMKKENETAKWVHFLMPQVIEGFESKDAKHDGGFFPSRFSRSWTYTIYKLPLGPGRSNLVTFRMEDGANRRWLGVPKKRPAKIWMRDVLVSASQTHAENEPVIRVMFFADFAF